LSTNLTALNNSAINLYTINNTLNIQRLINSTLTQILGYLNTTMNTQNLVNNSNANFGMVNLTGNLTMGASLNMTSNGTCIILKGLASTWEIC
jgi:hypothetical protein